MDLSSVYGHDFQPWSPNLLSTGLYFHDRPASPAVPIVLEFYFLAFVEPVTVNHFSNPKKYPVRYA